jgi:hypothetical protein
MDVPWSLVSDLWSLVADLWSLICAVKLATA